MDTTVSHDRSSRPTLRERLRDLGERRLASSVLLGAASLALTLGTTVAGIQIALDRSGFSLESREDPWITAAVALGATFVALFGAIVGFLGGVSVLPAAFVAILGWSRPMVTALYIVAFEVAGIFIFVLLTILLSDGPLSDIGLLAMFVFLGGIVPAAARFVAMRGQSTSPGTAQRSINEARA